MNQELRQRIIGAVVVTALAAIFIPMLFDDPVDDSGQVVSELAIPQAPTAAEDTAKNLPESIDDAAKKTEPSPESLDSAAEEQHAEEPLETPAENGVLSSDALESQALSEEEQEQGYDQPFDEAKNPPSATNPQAPALDTGIVEEDSGEEAPVKKAAPVKPKTVAKAIEQQPVRKAPPPPAPKAVPATKTPVVTAVEKLEKPAKKNPALVRWYIQAGSFSKKENALSLSENLRKQGMPVLLETIQIGGKGTFYRLKVGPELDKKRAAAMKAKLDQQNIKNILISE